MHVVTLPRVIISALSGGGGKTFLSIGLAGALRQLGFDVLPFKKGPDYIDAAWLSAAAGRSASNLDPFFLEDKRLLSLFLYAQEREHLDAKKSIALVEGNRGIFDGMDLAGSCSTAALARCLDAPVVLSLDATKMTRTAAALVQGIMHFETGLRFAGIVLNRVGRIRHADYLRASIEAYTDMPVLGALPRLDWDPLPERHMGIATMLGDRLSEQAEASIQKLVSLVRENIDVQRIVEAAKASSALEKAEPFWSKPRKSLEDAPRIGYVRDECLWFYYRENLEALEQAGAKIVRLSLLDEKPWSFEALDALYLGGGFPEDYLAALSQSAHMPRLAQAVEAGFPIYAECGGFMILCRAIHSQGKRWPMAGVLGTEIELTKRPQGLGYVDAIARACPYYQEGDRVRGHEFHYSRVLPGTVHKAESYLSLVKGSGMGDGIDGLLYKNCFGAYTHIFAPSLASWADKFVALAREYRKEKPFG